MRLVTSGKCLSIIFVKVQINICRYLSVEMLAAHKGSQGVFCKSNSSASGLKVEYLRYFIVLCANTGKWSLIEPAQMAAILDSNAISKITVANTFF